MKGPASLEQTELEIRAEKAAALTRIARRLEALLARCEQLAAEARAATGPARSALRDARRDTRAEALRYYPAPKRQDG